MTSKVSVVSSRLCVWYTLGSHDLSVELKIFMSLSRCVLSALFICPSGQCLSGNISKVSGSCHFISKQKSLLNMLSPLELRKKMEVCVLLLMDSSGCALYILLESQFVCLFRELHG